MGLNTNIFHLRKSFGYSQDEIASKLNVSRQTYIKFEKGTCELNASQIEQLAKFFGVNISEFYYEVQNKNKFKQMLMYILMKFNERGVTKTKLAKLLYLCDFRHYYNTLESMSNVIYKCKDYGPLAEPFLETVDDMLINGELHMEYLTEGAQILSLSKSVNPSKFALLSTFEKQEIDEICKKWEKVNSQELVNFTHQQKPWMACRPNEQIPYDLILQEDPDNVF